MPFEAYKLYQEYEPDKYKTSTQEKVARALAEAKKEGLVPKQEAIDFKEVKEILGKDFIGPEAVEMALGIKLSPEELEQVENIPFTREELEQAKELGMMLVLRVPHDKDKQPLTLNRMREILAGEDKLGDPKKKKSKLIYSQPGEGWYNNEAFATGGVTGFGWGLAKKEVLQESLSKNWDEQEEILKKWAEENNIDPQTIRRRTPIEVAYDTMLYYGANKEALLGGTYDWTSVQSSVGRFVNVGDFDSGGLNVSRDTRDGRDSDLGVCPAR
ncbi:MAG: hypothetical protein Greene041614_834 [Parcubacteria group bacterium Greene0416_14]|nr:MAG: hypothetical protein Greene041614_834 [Parcubacteria group bacterium Greene0416_14]